MTDTQDRNQALTSHRKETWAQEYRGVLIEIAHHGLADGNATPGMNDDNGIWNYYLCLAEDLFQDNEFEDFWLPLEKMERDRAVYDYSTDLLCSLDFHGGITFYEKHLRVDTNRRWVKLGCDYAHLYDEPRYEKEEVWRDACNSVDKLRRVYSNMNLRCIRNGKCYNADEGEINDYGNFASFDSKLSEKGD